MNILLAGFVKIKLILMDFKDDTHGVTAIEYAILAVAVSAIVYAVFGNTSTSPLKAALSGAVSTVAGNIDGANG